jgi:hypothetical protein
MVASQCVAGKCQTMRISGSQGKITTTFGFANHHICKKMILFYLVRILDYNGHFFSL